MDEEVEEADAIDMRISGTTLTIRRTLNRFEFIFENASKIIELGKRQSQLNGYNEAYAKQNTIQELGIFNNGRSYQNNIQLKHNELVFESILNLQHKQLKIKSLYLKQEDD